MYKQRCLYLSSTAAGITKTAINLPKVQWKNEKRRLQTLLHSSQGWRNFSSLPKQFLEELSRVENVVLSESAFYIIWNWLTFVVVDDI
jgi:hypothetical protein